MEAKGLLRIYFSLVAKFSPLMSIFILIPTPSYTLYASLYIFLYNRGISRDTSRDVGRDTNRNVGRVKREVGDLGGGIVEKE